MSREAALAATLLFLAAIPATARADDCEPHDGVSTCVDADELWARPGSSPFVAVGPGSTTPRGEVSLGLVLSYAKRPIVARIGGADPAGRDSYVVDNLFDGSFLFALGVTKRFEVTLAFPVTFYEDGAGTSFATGSTETLPRSTVRDGRFGFAYAFLSRPQVGNDDGLSVIARLEIGAPWGNGDAFAGAKSVTWIPAVTADFRRGRFDASAEIGARIRDAAPIAGVEWGSQLTFALAANVTLWPRAKLAIGAEAFAYPELFDQTAGATLVPSEWMADVTAAPILGGDVSFGISGGGAIPLTASSLGAPLVRVGGIVRYAPTERDTDGDGIPDRTDKCPTQKEDRDGFQDEDGCPDPDNDGDGIPDDKDRCRDEPEDKDGFQDDDGCPDIDDHKAAPSAADHPANPSTKE